jgi:hypothetical protein
MTRQVAFNQTGDALWSYWESIIKEPERVGLFETRWEELYWLLRTKYEKNTLMNGGIKLIRIAMIEKSGINKSYEEARHLEPFRYLPMPKKEHTELRLEKRAASKKLGYVVDKTICDFWQELTTTVFNAPILTVRDVFMVFGCAMLCTGKRPVEVIWTTAFTPHKGKSSRIMDFSGQAKIKKIQGDILPEGELYCLFQDADLIHRSLYKARKIVRGERLNPERLVSEVMQLPAVETPDAATQWLLNNQQNTINASDALFGSILQHSEDGVALGTQKGERLKLCRAVYFNIMCAAHTRRKPPVDKLPDELSALYLNHLGEGSSKNYQRVYAHFDNADDVFDYLKKDDRFWELHKVITPLAKV